MKNLCFLLIVSVVIISCSENSTSEIARAIPVNNKELSHTCNNDKFSFAGLPEQKQFTGAMAHNVSYTENKSCGTNTEKERSGSCSTAKTCSGKDKFWSLEAGCSTREDKNQCNTSSSITSNVNASL